MAAEDLNLGMEQAAEMAANAEMSAPSIQQSLGVDAALELGAAEEQASKQSFDVSSLVADGSGSPGGPGGGFAQQSAPVKPSTTSSDFMSSMDKVIDSSANDIFVERDAPKNIQDKLNKIEGPKTRYANQDLDLYRYQEDFDPKGFDPFNSKNYEHWTDKESWGSALGKGFDSFGTRFGNTFTDSFASYGRIGSALMNWDWDMLNPTESEMVDQNWDEYKESMKNYTFVPPEEEEDIFSKRTVSEFIGNAGFALGTFAALGVELVADAVLTFATGGGGAASFAATAARFGAKEGVKLGVAQTVKQAAKTGAFKFADFVVDMGKGATFYANQGTDALSAAAKVTNKAKQAENIASAGKVGSDALRNSMKEVFDIYTLNGRAIMKSKSFGELAGNIAKGVPLLGTGIRYGEKIAAGVKGGLSTGKLVGIGLQGTRRMLQEFNMSSTEAGFEAVTSYGSTLDMMLEQYRTDHEGQNPPADEFAKMQTKAMNSASSNYNTNLALLMVTNRLQFGTIFNRYLGANKWTKELLEEGAEKSFGVNRMWKSSTLMGKTYEKGFFGTYGLTGKIAKDFGKKQAVYQFGKQFMKDFARFEVTEGLQENLQETSSSAWKYYYAGQYNGTKYTLGQAFNNGMNEQFTKQGFRTFLQGALTGSMIRPATAVATKLTSYIQEKAVASNYKDNPNENPYVQMKERLKQDINLQNEMMSQMSNKKFEDNAVAFTAQVDSSLQQTESAAKSSQYEWQNAKDNSVLAGALAANRSGTIAVYQQALREMGKTMTDEEFEASTGTKLADTKYNTAEEFTAAMAKDVKGYSDTIDKIRRKVKSMPDPLMYEKGSKNRIVASIMNNAQEEAIKIVALNAMKATRASERAQAISQELLTIPGFANSAEFSIRVLANPENFQGEVGNMQAELKILQESLGVVDASQRENIKKKIKIKEDQIGLIDEWLNYWDNREQMVKRVDAETGEEGEASQKVYDTFVGMPFTVKEYDEDGNITDENGTAYSLDHKDIIETFRKFINSRNQEAGISDQVSEATLRDAFDKVVDYMRLDQDAKDYMQAMDLLYNPEYYKQTISRIQDGRFKYELLEFVDNIQDRIRSTILYTVANSDTDDMAERLQLIEKLYTELNTAIIESESYKNLVLLGIDETLGLDHAKFAEENAKKLNEVLQEKIAEIVDTYAPSAMSDDLSDDDYIQFQKTTKISGINMNIIARKVQSERTLSTRQAEAYKANKEDIDKLVNRLNDALKGSQDSMMQDMSLYGVAREKLVESGEFTEEDLKVMTDKQVLDLALSKGLIDPAEALKNANGYDQISDEIWNNFIANQEVEEGVLENIASRDYQGIALSEREKSILEARASEIADIQDRLEKEEAEANPVAIEPEEEPIPQELEQATDTEETTPDNVGGTVSNAEAGEEALLASIAQMNGGTTTDDDFEVKGSEDEGFDVTSKDGINVNSEKIESEDEAFDLADNLNNGRNNIDWARQFLGDLSKDEDETLKVDRMVNSGKRSLTAYNKKNGTDIKTLEDYYKIIDGKMTLDMIKESILTNTPLAKIKAQRKKQARTDAKEEDLFDSTSSPFVGGPALPLQSIQDLFDRLESMSAQTPAVDVVLNLNVESTTKNGNERLINDDPSIKMGDETQELNKLKRYGKTNYYINNGVLGVIIEGKDLFGRDNGSTKVIVKVPEGFNETIFAKLVADIKYPKSTTVAETERVLDEIREAIQKSIIQTTTNTKTDVEARRKYSIEELGVSEGVDGKIAGLYISNELNDDGTVRTIRITGPSVQAVTDRLNAKYNAENSEKIGKFVSEEEVSEDTVLDQLRKINSCFK